MIAEVLAFWLGVGKVLAWILAMASWLFLLGLLVEGVLWIIWKVWGIRVTAKGSPMYAEWHFIGWDWQNGNAIVDDKEDLRLEPRLLKKEGRVVSPWCFRLAWARESVYKQGSGPVFADEKSRLAAQEARRTIHHYNDTAPADLKITDEESLLANMHLIWPHIAERLAAEQSADTAQEAAS